MVLYDATTSNKLDSAVIKTGIPEKLLMMRAASSVWNIVEKLAKVSRVFSIAGPGNNGGDAYGVAIFSAIAGYNTSIYSTKEPSGTSKKIAEFCFALGADKLRFLPDPNEISCDDVIIDGLLGSGLNRPPTDHYLDVIEWINVSRKNGAKVIAIDIPSGLNASTGSTPGTAVKADFTMMCLSRKQGCFTGTGPDLCGNLSYANLGIEKPESLVDPTSLLISYGNEGVIKRPRSGHKGTFGSVLIIGGWPPMEGAGCMAGLAALRAGAGKVYVCGPSFPECPLELISVKRDLAQVDELLDQVDAVVAGPGLGKGADCFLEKAWASGTPLILDADGLNWLSESKAGRRQAYWIGTPHPGEARTLLGEEISDRFLALEKLQSKYGGVWVLKGAGTLVGPKPTYVNPLADSILATAGSGDILAGLIGGLTAQRLESPEIYGVWLHGKAAEYLKSNGQSTLLATDLLPAVSKVMKVVEA